jgi:hypothetical protein
MEKEISGRRSLTLSLEKIFLAEGSKSGLLLEICIIKKTLKNNDPDDCGKRSLRKINKNHFKM